MLHGIVLQVSVTCQRCAQPVHLQGLSEHTSCAACHASIPLPANQWKGWFGGQEIAEAMLMPSGKAREIRELSPQSTTYTYGNRMPRCQSCKTDLPADRIAELAEAGGWACSCGEWIQVRPASELARKLVRGARWLVNEGALSDGTESHSASKEPVLLPCAACGGTLQVDGKERTVTCTFCGGSNYLPDHIWLRLHPPHTRRPFFVVVEADEDNSRYLKTMARSPDRDLRARVARNPRTPLKALTRLARDEYSVVRRAAVQSGRLPIEALNELAAGERDLDVMLALMKLPLETSTLEVVAGSRDEVRRRMVARHLDTPESLLLQLAADSNPTVIEHLGKRPLPESVLRHLASRPEKGALGIAARQAGTPADLLVTLARSPHANVLKGLGNRPALPEPGGLPPKALLLLGKQSDPERAAAVRARPDYQAARVTQRTQLLLLIGGLLLLLLCAGVAIAAALFVTQLT